MLTYLVLVLLLLVAQMTFDNIGLIFCCCFCPGGRLLMMVHGGFIVESYVYLVISSKQY